MFRNFIIFYKDLCSASVQLTQEINKYTEIPKKFCNVLITMKMQQYLNSISKAMTLCSLTISTLTKSTQNSI